jgi:hypothetical protein
MMSFTFSALSDMHPSVWSGVSTTAVVWPI